MDRAAHPALLMVDAISSLGCADYRHDDWQVDVTIAGSQKGLMVPPGLSFTAISDKALAAARAGGSRRSYWDWEPLVTSNKTGFFPYTPAINLLYRAERGAGHAGRGGPAATSSPATAAMPRRPAWRSPPGGWSCNAPTRPPTRRA